MTHLRRLLAAAVLCTVLLMPRVGRGQAGTASLAGTVTEADSGSAVAGAVVELVGTARSVRTGVDGRFIFSAVAPGTVVLAVRRLGFRPLEVEVDLLPGEVFVIAAGAIALSPVPVELPGAVVEGSLAARLPTLERAGFYDRQAEGFGVFVDRPRLDEWNPGVVTDVLRRVPGVRVRPNPNYGRRPARFLPVDTRRFLVELSRNPIEGCDPVLFLDGLYIGTLTAFDVDVLVADEELAGMEVYRGASEVPPRFRLRGSTCGVLVLWTR